MYLPNMIIIWFFVVYLSQTYKHMQTDVNDNKRSKIIRSVNTTKSNIKKYY